MNGLDGALTMNVKLIISNAIISTLALTMAGYAQGNVSNSSHSLSDTQAQTCPALSDNTATTDTIQGNQQLAVPVRPNEVLDLTLLCYSGPSNFEDSTSVNQETNNSLRETPQSATQFDQLPQDRVKLDPLL